MTDQKLIKLEKAVEEKIKIPEQKKHNNKFVVDVARLKKLAERLNEYEAQTHVATQ